MNGDGGGRFCGVEVAAEETLRTCASATALGRQAPTGVGPPVPLRPSLPGDGHHGSLEATRRNPTKQPRTSQVQPSQRREAQQVEVHRIPTKGGGSAVPILVGPSPRADRALYTNPAPNAHRSPHSLQSAEQQASDA